MGRKAETEAQDGSESTLPAKRASKRGRERKPDTDGPRRGKTREKLMDAALDLLAEDEGGLAGLSLRSVTKRAGVSPTAFYRHFPDLEELGLAAIDESSEMLRRMLREVRKAGGANPEGMIRLSVKLFMMFVEQHRVRFLLMARERVGGSVRIRSSIRNTMAYFASELASDLQLMGVFPKLGTEELNRVAAMIIGQAVQAIPDILDLPEGATGEADELAEEIVRQMQILTLGALHLDPDHKAG